MEEEITGRDHYIIAKALAYAIALIDEMPEESQEASDRDDMMALLVARVPDEQDRKRLVHGISLGLDLNDFKIGMSD